MNRFRYTQLWSGDPQISPGLCGRKPKYLTLKMVLLESDFSLRVSETTSFYAIIFVEL